MGELPSTEVTVLDGGMGSELLRRLGKRTPLWSAQVLIDQPDLVMQTHLDYIDAGAQIITTNSYSTVPSYLASAGMESSYFGLTRLSGEIARRAVDASGKDALVAGSLPPLSESYRPDLVPPANESRVVYEEMAAALEPYVDLFLCETMSSAREGRNAAIEAKKAAAARGLPIYISWTLDEKPGRGLRSGETVAEAYETVSDLELDAFLFNCTSAEAINEGFRELTDLTDKPVGGYPNRFLVPEDWTLGQPVVEGLENTSAAFVQGALAAIEAGATIYGGCCTIGPADISSLSNALLAQP